MVADRAAILKAIVSSSLAAPPREFLAQAEWTAADRADFEQSAERMWLENWRKLGRLRSKLSPKERDHFRSTAATLSERQQVNGAWRLEALQALMWSLGLLADLPAYDIQALEELLRGYPPTDLARYRRAATLRPQSEIKKRRDVAELWHWRSRTRQIIEEGRPFRVSASTEKNGYKSYDDIVRYSAARAAEDGVTTLIDGDFSAMGKAYRDLTDDEWSKVRSITLERHFAFNWLCGYAPSNRWDETPTHT